MISCLLQGGLGNQLFQISTTLSLAWENNDFACFDSSKHFLPLQGKRIEEYQNNIFRNLDFRQISTNNFDFYNEESELKYNKIPYKKNLFLKGYFQSEKYFINNREKLLQIFESSQEIKEYINIKYKHLFEKETVSVHIRRGDYLKFQNLYHICGIDYYLRAIQRFKDNNFLIFSDDIEWCKKVFKNINYHIIEEEDYIELYIMSMCDHNIMANSSFSWWGAWLNSNPNKMVIAPKNWFINKINQDLYTKEQIIL